MISHFDRSFINFGTSAGSFGNILCPNFLESSSIRRSVFLFELFGERNLFEKLSRRNDGRCENVKNEEHRRRTKTRKRGTSDSIRRVKEEKPNRREEQGLP